MSSTFNIQTSLWIVTENAGRTHVHVAESNCAGLPLPQKQVLLLSVDVGHTLARGVPAAHLAGVVRL